MMREASRLAAAGELGNSDAIRLLQIPHRTEDVQEVLHAFEQQLSREAKSKLTLDAFVPPPSDVDQSAVRATLRQVPHHRQDLHDRQRRSGAERASVLQRRNGAPLRRVLQRLGGECRIGGQWLQGDDPEVRGRQARGCCTALVEQVHRHLDSTVRCHVHRGRCRARTTLPKARRPSGRTPMAHRACW